MHQLGIFPTSLAPASLISISAARLATSSSCRAVLASLSAMSKAASKAALDLQSS